MATTTPNYTVDYNDPRFTAVANEKQTQMNNINNTYQQMINDNKNAYSNMINSADEYAKAQSDIQNRNAELEIQGVQNNIEDATKSYEKEQRASYVDYMKQTNQYGANAQATRNLGLQNSGYSETSMVSMYNTYQNRVATAKESFDTAVRDYNFEIDKIRLQNDSNLMEISFNALQKKLELSLQQVTTNNQLLQSQMDRQYQYDTFYEQKYQNVLSQINTENALAEQVRQYNESMAYQRERDAVADAQWQKTYNLSKASSSSGGGGGGISKTPTGGGINASNNYGNDSSVMNKSDYYWDYRNDGNKSNDFQPSYINGHKLSTVKNASNKNMTASDILTSQEIAQLQKAGYGVVGTNKIFTEGGNYYVWSDKKNGYINLTDQYNTYKSATSTSSSVHSSIGSSGGGNSSGGGRHG